MNTCTNKRNPQSMTDAFILDGARSAFGRNAGVLADLRPDDLSAQLIKFLIDRDGIAPELIEDVMLGCACQAGEDSRNIARHAALLAGLPPQTPGMTVNRLCASGLSAVLASAHAIRAGEGTLFLAGGVESMTRAPWVLGKNESAYGRESKLFDSSIGSRFPNPKLISMYGDDSLAQTADNIGWSVPIAREESDNFALRSQQQYARALAEEFFRDEIAPVLVPGKGRAESRIVAADEHPRPEIDSNKLAELKPLNCNGQVTAGNASGINDGACVLIVGGREGAEAARLEPIARILSGAVTGILPNVMGLGPVLAIPKALRRAGLTLDDMAVIEINEAFATQVLGCLNRLGLDYADPRVNPNGGAIAIGHPLGASGARILLTAARELRRRNDQYAVVSLCVGVGQGIAVVIERL